MLVSSANCLLVAGGAMDHGERVLRELVSLGIGQRVCFRSRGCSEFAPDGGIGIRHGLLFGAISHASVSFSVSFHLILSFAVQRRQAPNPCTFPACLTAAIMPCSSV